ncbi:hypothetical protein [uncultured Methylobacterium sp.]|jgi:hypothetical protein|uniref:hypothetical protein n=1 Tax=uncultured Methylobacterium sp. TaxID=157278 RepID=UPI0026236431|nr:hypothetical protein [uncultured Methylobacterium sp.]
MDTKLYRVTAAAPARLFGRRAGEGDLLTLHEREARFEVDQGWIEEVADAPTAVVTGSDGPGLSFGTPTE